MTKVANEILKDVQPRETNACADLFGSVQDQSNVRSHQEWGKRSRRSLGKISATKESMNPSVRPIEVTMTTEKLRKDKTYIEESRSGDDIANAILDEPVKVYKRRFRGSVTSYSHEVFDRFDSHEEFEPTNEERKVASAILQLRRHALFLKRSMEKIRVSWHVVCSITN